MRDVLRQLGRIRSRLARPSFGLNGLDHRLARYLPRHRGVFIEAGANDGIRQSNTLYLERYRGWSGLLVEPVPALAERCRSNRPGCLVENCALVASDYSGDTIEIRYCDLMSLVRGAMKSELEERRHLDAGRHHLTPGDEVRLLQVPARTLSSVLDAHGLSRVDLLSLDVEGYEAEVLRGIDFRRHRPRFILVESRCPGDIREVLDPLYREVAILSEYGRHQDILYRLRKQ